MKIKVKTAGLVGEGLPEGGGTELEIGAGATPVDVMGMLGIATDEGFLVALNDAVLAKDEQANVRLADGDTLAVLPPLAGG